MINHQLLVSLEITMVSLITSPPQHQEYHHLNKMVNHQLLPLIIQDLGHILNTTLVTQLK